MLEWIRRGTNTQTPRMKTIAPALMLMAVLAAGAVRAEQFGVPFFQWTGEQELPTVQGPVVFDLRVPLQTVTAIHVTVSGIHSNGWWDGAGFDTSGPRGGALTFVMGSSIAGSWTVGTFMNTNGPFSITMSDFDGDRSILTNGISDFYMEYGPQPSFGGLFTTLPRLLIYDIILTIEGERQFRIYRFSPNGSLSWLPAGTQGTTRIERAASPTGSWGLLTSVAAAQTNFDLELPTASGFFRVRRANGE